MAGRRRRPGVLSRFLKLLSPGILEKGRDKKKTNGATLKRAASANRFHCLARLRQVGPLLNPLFIVFEACPTPTAEQSRDSSLRFSIYGRLSSSYSRLCFFGGEKVGGGAVRAWGCLGCVTRILFRPPMSETCRPSGKGLFFFLFPRWNFIIICIWGFLSAPATTPEEKTPFIYLASLVETTKCEAF